MKERAVEETKKKLELYLHIPFCIQKCAYCDFLSAPSNEKERQRYVEFLVREIQSCARHYDDYEVCTIFMGGGTPSILSGAQITQIFDALYDWFYVAEDAEITIEVNPATVSVCDVRGAQKNGPATAVHKVREDVLTAGKLEAWKKAGINRVSIGLQSADDEELKRLGRVHTCRQFTETYRAVRETGFQNVNVDLISAIPGQTLESWERTLQCVTALEPEHISAYSLIVEEGTPFYEWYGDGRKAQNMPPLPDEETERNMYERTEEILASCGYHRYEISNYAKKGCECRHNIGYWKRIPYLGIGLGAASLIENVRFHRPNRLTEYYDGVRGKALLCEEREELSVQEQMEEFMFLGLRMMEGVSAREFERQFGSPLTAVYGDVILDLKGKGLLAARDDKVFLTKRGIDISNYVFASFL